MELKCSKVETKKTYELPLNGNCQQMMADFCRWKKNATQIELAFSTESRQNNSLQTWQPKMNVYYFPFYCDYWVCTKWWQTNGQFSRELQGQTRMEAYSLQQNMVEKVHFITQRNHQSANFWIPGRRLQPYQPNGIRPETYFQRRSKVDMVLNTDIQMFFFQKCTQNYYLSMQQTIKRRGISMRFKSMQSWSCP